MSDKRLIDANAVENHLFYTTKENDDYNEGYFDGVRDAKEIVRGSKTIDPKTLRPVAHWEDVPGSYKDHIGKDGSWFVPTTRCTNPECREINPCSLKTPFCPMCGFRMEDVPYDVD